MSHSSDWGGAENYLYHLVAGLDRTKFAPIVVLPKPGILQEKIESLGVPIRYTELRWCVGTSENDQWQYTDFVGGLKRRVQLLADLIRNERIELVFTNTAVILEGALAAYFCGKPHVWYVLELLGSNPSLFPYLDLGSVFTLMNTLADKIVVNSESALSQLLPFVPNGKTQTIYFGRETIDETQVVLDRQRAFGLDPSVPIISYVGVLARTKGVLTLPDAAALVKERCPRARFVIAGEDGDVADLLREQIRKKGVENSFHFLGFRSDALNVIANSDILVLPSVAESFGIVALEAMLTGKPVVTTRSGGPAEIVIHGETGFVVPVNDSTELANALIRLLEDPIQREIMGERGRARALDRFGYRRYVREFERIFEDLAIQPKRINSVGIDLIKILLNLYEEAYSDKLKLLENDRKARDHEMLVRRIQSNPLFKIYHTLKYLGRA